MSRPHDHRLTDTCTAACRVHPDYGQPTPDRQARPRNRRKVERRMCERCGEPWYELGQGDTPHACRQDDERERQANEGAGGGEAHYCDGYGPQQGWCGDASATDCTCAYSHRLHAEGEAAATARIVAWLRDEFPDDTTSAMQDDAIYRAANAIEGEHEEGAG